MTSKKQLLRQAKRDGYSLEFVKRWIRFYGLMQTREILKAFRSPPKRSIFLNFGKYDPFRVITSLKSKGFRLVKSKFHLYCRIIAYQPFSLSSTPEYLTGQFMILSETSVLPPILLEKFIQKNEGLLIDMAAAPGIKTSLLSMFFQGFLILAIERNPSRVVKLRSNMSRLGIENVACIQADSRRLEKVENLADGILLDAPCTGSGIIHKDLSRKNSRSIHDVLTMSSIQKQLVKAAVKTVRENGMIVYSTCSLEPEENEDVISWALDNLSVELVDVRNVIKESWKDDLKEPVIYGKNEEHDAEIKRCVRIFPSSTRDGFFIALIKKIG